MTTRGARPAWAVAVGLLVTAFVIVLIRDAPPPPGVAGPETSRTTEPGETLAQAVARPLDHGLGPRQELGAGDPGRRGWVIEGELREWRGQRRARATFAVRASGARDPWREVTTDDEGRFALQLPPEFAESILETRTEGGFCWYEPHGQPIRVLAASGVRVYRILADAAIQGSVVDPRGAPIEGARVELVFAGVGTETDDGGRFSLPAPSRTTVKVRCEVAGYPVISERVRLATGGRAELVLRLRDGVVASGVVKDEAGAGVAGAEVVSARSGRAARTVGDGSFRLHVHELTELDSVCARKPGYGRVFTSLDHRRSTVIVLQRGVVLEGRVVDREGWPIAGALVECYVEHDADAELSTRTGVDGGYRVLSVPAGSRTIAVHARGFAVCTRVLELHRDREWVEFRLDPGQGLRVRVVDGAGTGVAGATVSIKLDDQRSVAVGRSFTDEDGSTERITAPDRPLLVIAYKPGFMASARRVAGAGSGEVSVGLARAGVIAGRVVDGASGAPIDAFRLRFVPARADFGNGSSRGYSAYWADEGVWFAGASGRWVVDDQRLRAGDIFTIEVRAAGYAETVLEGIPATLEPEPDEIVARMWPR